MTLLVAAVSLVGAPAALASPTPPKGAYWFTLLDLKRAWRITEGAGVTVAVVDSGVQASLNTLRGQVKPGLDLSGNDPHAQHDTRLPGNGDFGHGTDMAALIAGTGHGGGLPGIAPKAKILPVDADDSAGADTSQNTAQGINWAVSHGADIINVSLGRPGACDSAEGAAIANAYRHNIIVDVSAGDSAGPVSSPADCPGALAIGGVDAAVMPWTKTPSGPDIDFVAPAFNLVNQDLGGELNGPAPGNAGTSQAAAIVSGTFALLKAKFPDDTARQLVTRALYNVHNGLGPGKQGVRAGDELGYGMILPRYALTEAAPHGAKNPIYDRFAQEIPSGSATSPPSSAGRSTPAAEGSTPASAATAASSGSGGGSSVSPILIVVIVVVVIGAIVVAVVAISRSRRRRPPPAAGYPGGGYPPTH